MADPQQKPANPYAEFGGTAVADDPYAEFGGGAAEPLSMRQHKGGYSGQAPLTPDDAAQASAIAAHGTYGPGVPSGYYERPGTGPYQSNPTKMEMLKEGGKTLGLAAAYGLPALATGGLSLPAEMAVYGAGGAASTALTGGTAKQSLISGGIGAGLPLAGSLVRAVAPPLVRGIGRGAGAIADAIDPDVTGMISPRAAHIQRLAGKVARIAGRVAPEAASGEAAAANIAPHSSDQVPGAPYAPRPRAYRASSTIAGPSRPGLMLSGEVASPSAGPAVATPPADIAPSGGPAATSGPEDLLQNIRERRGVSAPPDLPKYVGPERRGTPPVPEDLGFDFRSAEDLGNKVRQETGKLAPKGRGKVTALQQSEALGQGAQIASPSASPATSSNLDSTLREALGNKPVRPGVSMRDQFKPGVATPSGHTPAESTAVQSYKYDPSAHELHVTAHNGITYVSGEVSPEQAAAFQNADSKGQAWKQIRDSSPLVGKISSGNRIAVKPSAFRSATPEDLGSKVAASPGARIPGPNEDMTDLLNESLRTAKKKTQ